jgi:holliday junction DNA helicase RuvA
MIAFLKGSFEAVTPSQVWVNVGGVGYAVYISTQTYAAIQNSAEGKLFTHLQITENAHTLFGFFTQAEKELFIHLIGVSGVGASTARAMLSGMNAEQLIKCIIHGNVKQLESIKGIGKKTAERIIVELRDKLGKQALESVTSHGVQWSVGTGTQEADITMDAVNALVNLGIPKPAADAAVKKVTDTNPSSTLEDYIKLALKNL